MRWSSRSSSRMTATALAWTNSTFTSGASRPGSSSGGTPGGSDKRFEARWGGGFAMPTVAPSGPLWIGHLVRRRIDPVNTPLVGVVGGLIFADQNLALVRWPGAWSTFEPEDTLIAVSR